MSDANAQVRRVATAMADKDQPIPAPRYALGQIVWKVSGNGIVRGQIAGRGYSDGVNRPGTWGYTVKFEGIDTVYDHGESFLFESPQAIAEHFQALACEEREKREGKR